MGVYRLKVFAHLPIRDIHGTAKTRIEVVRNSPATLDEQRLAPTDTERDEVSWNVDRSRSTGR